MSLSSVILPKLWSRIDFKLCFRCSEKQFNEIITKSPVYWCKELFIPTVICKIRFKFFFVSCNVFFWILFYFPHHDCRFYMSHNVWLLLFLFSNAAAHLIVVVVFFSFCSCYPIQESYLVFVTIFKVHFVDPNMSQNGIPPTPPRLILIVNGMSFVFVAPLKYFSNFCLHFHLIFHISSLT